MLRLQVNTMFSFGEGGMGQQFLRDFEMALLTSELDPAGLLFAGFRSLPDNVLAVQKTRTYTRGFTMPEWRNAADTPLSYALYYSEQIGTPTIVGYDMHQLCRPVDADSVSVPYTPRGSNTMIDSLVVVVTVSSVNHTVDPLTH